MNFSTDRDILAIEPNVFNDVPFVSQQRVRVTDGQVTGTTLTSVSADFVATNVGVGSVVLIAGVACEVVAQTDANTLTVSLPRDGLVDAAIPPGDGSGLEVTARTFAPQASLVHDLLLHALGIDPDVMDATLTEDSIVSLSVMARLEALGTLERIYSAAQAIAGDNDALHRKAQHYRRAFSIDRARAIIMIDLDGDGYADAKRSLGVHQMVRV